MRIIIGIHPRKRNEKLFCDNHFCIEANVEYTKKNIDYLHFFLNTKKKIAFYLLIMNIARIVFFRGI